jgi:hypothetical protein
MSIVISNPKDRQSLKLALVEMTNCLARMDSEREAKKDIAAKIKEDFDIKPATANKLAGVMYKQNYASLQQEQEDFELLYETLVEGRKADDDAAE